MYAWVRRRPARVGDGKHEQAAWRHLAHKGVVLVPVDATDQDAAAVVPQRPTYDRRVPERDLARLHARPRALAVRKLQRQHVGCGVLGAPQLHRLCTRLRACTCETSLQQPEQTWVPAIASQGGSQLVPAACHCGVYAIRGCITRQLCTHNCQRGQRMVKGVASSIASLPAACKQAAVHALRSAAASLSPAVLRMAHLQSHPAPM